MRHYYSWGKKALEEARRRRAGTCGRLDPSFVREMLEPPYKDRNSWKDTSVFSGNNKEIFDAELWAIADALEITRKMTLNNHNTPMKVFSDSQEALTAIRQLSFTRVVQR